MTSQISDVSLGKALVDPEELHEGPRVALGVHQPLSLQYPTRADSIKTVLANELMKELHLQETEDGNKRRKRACDCLFKLLSDWVRRVAIGKGASASEFAPGRDQGIRLYTFGSFRLGVVTPEGDIDACVVICNDFVDRDDFFSQFSEVLQHDPRTEKIVRVPEAYTPIIKFKFMHIDFDLLFAKLKPKALRYIIADDIGNNQVLAGADIATVRCLNGIRVNEKLLELLPNKDAFRGALRLLKQWATNRGTYSNVLGYFGGITWAILVAQICQVYPHACAATILFRFFEIYAKHNWAQPVMLCHIEKGEELHPQDRKELDDPWSFDDPSARSHLMPILTPAFPSMNSTHNVSTTTRDVLIQEFQRGHDICRELESMTAEVASEMLTTADRASNPWSRLIQPCEIFRDHEFFIFVEIYGYYEESFKDYCGFVESKLRLLVKRLEIVNKATLRPWPEAITFTPPPELSVPLLHDGNVQKSYAGYAFGQGRVIALNIIPKARGSGSADTVVVDYRPYLSGWTESIQQWDPPNSAFKSEVNLRVVVKRRDELPSYCRHSFVFPKANKT